MRTKKIFIFISAAICLGIIVYVALTKGGQPPKQNEKEYLLDIIEKDIPEIRKISDELEYLHTIREWVFSETMLAGTKEYYGQVFCADKGKPGTKEYYDNMYAAWDREGYYCGEIAYFLMDVYMMLGYRSLAMDMAVCDKEGNVISSHVVTLVLYGEKWIVEDATFNLTYTDDEGNVLDIREIKERVVEKKSIKRICGVTKTKLYISSLPYYGVYECINSYEENGIYFYEIIMDADQYWNKQPPLVKSILELDGLTYDFENIYFYCYRCYNPMQVYMNKLENDLGIKVH